MDPVTIRVPVAIMDPWERSVMARVAGTVTMSVVSMSKRKSGLTKPSVVPRPFCITGFVNIGSGPMLFPGVLLLTTIAGTGLMPDSWLLTNRTAFADPLFSAWLVSARAAFADPGFRMRFMGTMTGLLPGLFFMGT